MGFRMAKRSSAKPLVGLYSASGCGKTLSALYLARGFVGPNGKIGMIDTEAGRGEAFADMIPGSYTVEPIADNFGPKVYEQKIKMAEKDGVDALIIDSASHEWEGAGGVLSMAEDNRKKGITARQVWTQPKVDHNRHFILPLMQTPISIVIVCMRGKFPLIESGEKDKRGNPKLIKSEVPVPIQSDQILFEMFIHGWIDEDHCFRGTKYTRPDLRDVIIDKQRISIETGQALAAWSAGGKVEPKSNGIIDDVLKMIASAESKSRLTEIGAEVKEMTLAGADAQRARAAYIARDKELS